MATLAHPAPNARPRAISAWLLAVAGLVFLMVVIGGITRLTESGLSMVRWEPISGVVPPLNDAQWQAEFEAYKAYPEYQKVNRGMSLGEFKSIFFWEYLHRLLGRLIGVAFALPLLWFAVRRAIPSGYGPRLTGLLILGGLQGFVGWWMVASGLIDRPDVAHDRLATHLTLALLIFAGLIWTALDLRDPAPPAAPRPSGWVRWFLPLLFVQIVWGAFVAGLNGGYAFNTWPLMGDHVMPPHVAEAVREALANLINDPVVTQFIHRSLAIVVALFALHVAGKLWKAGAGSRALALGGAVLLQFALGVATLLSGVNIVLGVAHQAGAAVLLAATIWAAHWATRKPVVL
ncbi:COX15/CtaA family protein [Sphingoaurantiacus capsulatus]|uniref:Heme A synthase n=1 Tax=Sphingoaurantiacus capsulatus TaxID=1771310 RepID=A0ABV7XBH4_9SPHN